MTLYQKTNPSVGANEAFVTMMGVAKEDAEIKMQLITILSQNRFNRASILNSYIEDLRLQKAPKEFIAAIACLLDDRIAAKALEILREFE
jgi:hypothetical protein